MNQTNTDDSIMIRIRNDSSFDFQYCWLGAGPNGGATQTTDYGRIKSGATSRYRHIESIFENYEKIDIVIDGKRYLDTIDPQTEFGVPELAPGKYTFAYDIVNGETVLTFIED